MSDPDSTFFAGVATERQAAAIPFYNSLMEEVKARLEVLAFILSQSEEPDSLPRPILAEFGFLQLRMTCELIASGCLVAHGDISGAHGLKGEYAADRIVNALDRLNPDFFPKGVKAEVVKTYANGHRHLHLSPITEGTLDKAGLVALYRKCGDALHVGSLKKLGNSKRLGDDIPYIAEHLKKLVVTLTYHSQILLGARTIYLCALKSAQHDGRVNTVISQASDQLPPGYE